MLRTALAVAFALTASHEARSQSSLAAPDSTEWKAWGSLALGPATANGAGRLGANIALWVTRDQLAIGFHEAGASRFTDPGDVYDWWVLAGIHPHLDPHADFVAGLGARISRGHDNGGGNLGAVPVIVAGANLMFNYRVVGIGLDGFAAVGVSRRCYGVGLALGVGSFH